MFSQFSGHPKKPVGNHAHETEISIYLPLGILAHLLKMVSWKLNTLVFGGDYIHPLPLAHHPTFGDWICRVLEGVDLYRKITANMVALGPKKTHLHTDRCFYPKG